MPSFLGGKSRGASRQPAFFLAENAEPSFVFEKEVSLAKRLFESTEVLYLRNKKHLISINGKKKLKRILNCMCFWWKAKSPS